MSRDRLARWFAQTALIWLLVAALMGVWLRWQAWGAPPLVFNFRFLTHAHSHLMFLGWVYNALAALLIVGFLPGQPGRVYVWLWAGLQAGLLGMAVFFPLQGYAAGSIGVITAALIAVFIQKNWLPTGQQTTPGWWLLIGGYVCTELVLALPGASPAALFGAALAMLAGLVWVVGRKPSLDI